MAKTKDNKSLDEIIRVLREELPRLRKSHGVRSLGVFGSYLRGEQKKRSDLDVLIEFRQTPGLIGFIGLRNELSDRLGVKVDLVMKDALKPSVRDRVLSEVVPI
jgi:uncharacterized protein